MKGGDIIELTYNHNTLGTGVFFVKSAEDNTFDLGGFRKSDDENMIAGNGEVISIMNQKRWKFECTLAWDMNLNQSLENLVALAESPEEADWTISHINGVVYGGNGSPVGDLKGNGNAATIALIISGGGKLKKLT